MTLNKRVQQVFIEALYDIELPLDEEYFLRPRDEREIRNQATFVYYDKPIRVYRNVTPSSVMRLMYASKDLPHIVPGHRQLSKDVSGYDWSYEYICPHCGGEV